MKAWLKVLLGISLSFMCLFSSVGYAALSSTTRIFGSARASIPYGLFIVDIESTDPIRIDKNQVTYLPYTTTVDSTLSRWRSG